RAVLRVAFRHLVIDGGVRLVHLVTADVDDLPLHRFGLGEGVCAEREHERESTQSGKQFTHAESFRQGQPTRAYTTDRAARSRADAARPGWARRSGRPRLFLLLTVKMKGRTV